ncbi:hypothetical protein BDD12DRAFT_908974 [Trichophaea hybrida]|nr:hypothetical protein BDD12DRAFT_908974 [Trichophaea hybrida]
MEKLVDVLTSFPTSMTLPDPELTKQSNALLQNYLYKVPANNLASNMADELIERGEISATLSQDPSTSQTTVHFDSSPVEEARNLAALEEQIQRIVALNQQQGKNSGGNGPPGLMTMDSDMMDLEYGATWGDDDPDETVMQDFDEVM